MSGHDKPDKPAPVVTIAPGRDTALLLVPLSTGHVGIAELTPEGLIALARALQAAAAHLTTRHTGEVVA